MKKVIYIGIAVVTLGLASCSKQDIQPTNDAETVPVGKSFSNSSTDPISTGGSSITDPEIDGEIDGEITDPEIDN